MQLSTLTFFAFCIVTAAVYHFLGRRFKKYALLAASYYFYESWSTQFLAAILVFTLANYAIGRVMGRASRYKRLMLIIGIGFNVFFLLMLKYADFFVPALANLLSQIGLSTPALAILFPIGLSYMVLQAIGYLVDIYRNEMQPESDLVVFALFIAYFPKIISGPIESARRFIPQIKEPAPLTRDQAGQGLYLFLDGLFRKRVLADVLWAMQPYQQIFNDLNAGKLTILLWILAAVVALYMDFSGYSNIARGISKFFGIELSLNFRAPLLAPTVTDLWSRWHISFTNWVREYIFYPLSRVMIRRTRSARHALNYVIPITATMLFSALWHDIAVEHILWAGLMGLILIYEQHRRINQPANNPAQKRFGLALPVILLLIPLNTLFLNSFADTVTIWRALIFTSPFSFNPDALRPLILVMPALLIEWTHYRTNDELWLTRMHRVGPFIAAAALLMLFLVSYTDLITAAFIYQDF